MAASECHRGEDHETLRAVGQDEIIAGRDVVALDAVLDAVPAGAAGEGDGLATVHWLLTHHREVRQQAIQDTHNRPCPALETARLSHRRIAVSRS